MKPLAARPAPCLLAAALLVACGAPPAGDRAADSGTAFSAAAAPTEAGYPALYLDLQLPVLPDGRITSSRQAASLRDGLSLQLASARPVGEVREYYSTELRQAGWQEAPSRVTPGAPMAGLSATRDDIRYTMIATAQGDDTQITITVVGP